jgi:hypothetical protein
MGRITGGPQLTFNTKEKALAALRNMSYEGLIAKLQKNLDARYGPGVGKAAVEALRTLIRSRKFTDPALKSAKFVLVQDKKGKFRVGLVFRAKNISAKHEVGLAKILRTNIRNLSAAINRGKASPTAAAKLLAAISLKGGAGGKVVASSLVYGYPWYKLGGLVGKPTYNLDSANMTKW